jgi:uracil-DNA glycosylase family protein
MAASKRSWNALREAASHCRECPLGARATQTVWGEGPLPARLMLVGEQPGDREDIAGHPFVGPAGRLLDQAIASLGWERQTLYVTNAVKHFSFELRGKRRIHKTPAQLEILACLHWLESEIDSVGPSAIVALGRVAASALLGRPIKVMTERGHWLRRSDGIEVLITVHPSALLRGDPAQKEAAYAAWLDDLSVATPRIGVTHPA